jgi:hypothetical protein
MIDAIAKERSFSAAADVNAVADDGMNLHDGALGSLLSLRITVTPVSGRAGAYSVRVNGRDGRLCVSRQPLLDAARHLIHLGNSPDSVIEMWWPDADHFSPDTPSGRVRRLTTICRYRTARLRADCGARRSICRP